MKNNGKILLSLFLTAFVCFALALVSALMPATHSEFKGTYDVNAFAEEGETPDGEEPEQPKQEVSATVYATRCNVSTTKDYILMVTAFNANPQAYSEIGYNVSVDGGESVQIGTNKYYTGLTVKSAGGEDVTLTATQIYGQEIEHIGLIVYEMEYDPNCIYSITAYMTPNTTFEENNNATVNPGTGNDVVVGNVARSIEIGGNYVVNEGDSLEGLDVQVLGNFRDGQRVLDRSEYSLSIPEGEAKFGNGYQITATYLKNENLTASKTVAVSATFQSENAVIVGGQKVAETGYTPDLQSVGVINSVGEFAKTVAAGNEGSITYYVNAKTAGTANLVFRMANSNLRKTTSGSATTYYMAELQLNTVMDLTVNGGAVAIANDVVIPGSTTNAKYIPLYNIYHDVAINGVTLKAGVNAIKISFKMSTTGEVNSWDESPSTANVDYLTVIASNNVITAGATITAIDVDSAYKPAYGDAIANTAVLATMSDGQQMLLEKDEYTITNGEKDWYAANNNVTVKLVSDATITLTKTITTSVTLSIKYTHADLVQEGDKVYYKLTFTSKGYEISDFNLYDGTTTYAIAKYEQTPTQMITYVDVTGWGAGTTLWPHLKIRGVAYNNGNANKAGDILGGTYESGKTFVANGKRFILYTQYNMPTAMVVATSEKHLAWGGKGVYLSAEKANASDAQATIMYYCVEFEMWGYEGATFTLFDGNTKFNVTIPALSNAYYVVKFNITDLGSATTAFYPHLAIDGTTYTGFHKSGDLICPTFTDGAYADIYVTGNGQTRRYTLKAEYDMPTIMRAYI